LALLAVIVLATTACWTRGLPAPRLARISCAVFMLPRVAAATHSARRRHAAHFCAASRRRAPLAAPRTPLLRLDAARCRTCLSLKRSAKTINNQHRACLHAFLARCRAT